METSLTVSPAQRQPAPPRKKKRHAGLIWIGVFKLVKVVLLLMTGFVVVGLMHKNLADVVDNIKGTLHLDPDGGLVHFMLNQVLKLNPETLKRLGVGLFVYAVLYTFEGIGLVLEKTWGEYLTLVTTSLLIPLEIYEIFRAFGWVKVSLFVLNVLILVYIVIELKKKWKSERAEPGT